MARAATTRSQKAPKVSQSQARPSQSQRANSSRNQAPEDDDEDENEEYEDDANMAVDEDGDGGREDSERDIFLRKANDLVRLALFIEHKRTPLRREDILKKVLGSNSRSFNPILNLAQKILRKTFGMELVELRSRADLDKVANNPDNDDEARTATGVRKKAAAAGSKTYILRSVLDPITIEHAALTDEQILEEEAVDIPSDDDDDDFGTRTYGSIISWSHAEQLGPTGILYVVLALILVSGRVMSDMDLRANLKRLRLPSTSTLTFNSQSTRRTLPLEQYLSLLIRQGFIDRQRVGDAKKAKGKRGRPTQDDEEGTTYEWRWGNRAQSEVGEMGIAKFIAEFMVGEGEDDGDEEEEGGRARAKKRQVEADNKLSKMMKGIARAAGGELAELK